MSYSYFCNNFYFNSFLFLLDIIFICFSSNSPFLVSPQKLPIPLHICASMRIFPTHTLPPPHTRICLHWDIKPSQDQGPLLTLMSD